MSYSLPVLSPTNVDFPDPSQALKEPNGLLAMGGDLSVSRLLSAYKQGIFPWYDSTSPILWWSPDPRAILICEDLIISKSLKKVLQKKSFTYSCDQNFEQVIGACGTRYQPNGQLEETWITDELKKAYIQLHQMEYAHSIEVWQDHELVGGLYGACIGQCFFGESMFHTVSDMSKVALVLLVQQLKRWGFKWIDCQVWSSHLGSLGATEIQRSEFLHDLKAAISIKGPASAWQLDYDLLQDILD